MQRYIKATKADVGGVGGHVVAADEVKSIIAKYVLDNNSYRGEPIFTSMIVTHTGDDCAVTGIMAETVDMSVVDELMWDALQEGATKAAELGLYGPGQDLVADAFTGNLRGTGPATVALPFPVRKDNASQTVLVSFADKTEPMAFNHYATGAYMLPRFNTGLVIAASNMKRGYVFEIVDLDTKAQAVEAGAHPRDQRALDNKMEEVAKGLQEKVITLRAPEDLYDIEGLTRSSRFVIARIWTRGDKNEKDQLGYICSAERLHNIKTKKGFSYGGKDDPVLLAFCQGDWPAPGEITSPWATAPMVAGDCRGSHNLHILPMPINSQTSYWSGPILSAITLSCNIHTGRIGAISDQFSLGTPWDEVRRTASKLAIQFRHAHGIKQPATLHEEELEYQEGWKGGATASSSSRSSRRSPSATAMATGTAPTPARSPQARCGRPARRDRLAQVLAPGSPSGGASMLPELRSGSAACPPRLPARQPLGETGFDLAANTPEGCEPRLLVAGRARGILERPVQALHRTGQERTPFVRVVTDGDHVVPRLPEQSDVELRRVAADVNADLSQGLSGKIGDGGARLGASRVHPHCIASDLAHQPALAAPRYAAKRPALAHTVSTPVTCSAEQPLDERNRATRRRVTVPFVDADLTEAKRSCNARLATFSKMETIFRARPRRLGRVVEVARPTPVPRASRDIDRRHRHRRAGCGDPRSPSHDLAVARPRSPDSGRPATLRHLIGGPQLDPAWRSDPRYPSLGCARGRGPRHRRDGPTGHRVARGVSREERGRSPGPEQLGDDEGRRVRGADARERVRGRSCERYSRVRERRGRREPVRRRDVGGHRERDGIGAHAQAAPDHGEEPEGGHELAEHLRRPGARVTRDEEQRRLEHQHGPPRHPRTRR